MFYVRTNFFGVEGFYDLCWKGEFYSSTVDVIFDDDIYLTSDEQNMNAGRFHNYDQELSFNPVKNNNISDDMLHWLSEIVDRWNMTYNPEIGIGLHFYFTNSEDAIKFKLSWG